MALGGRRPLHYNGSGDAVRQFTWGSGVYAGKESSDHRENSSGVCVGPARKGVQRGDHRKLSPQRLGLCRVERRKSQPEPDGRMEGASCWQPCPRNGQHHTGGCQLLLCGHGVGGMPGQAPVGPAPQLSGPGAGAGPGGLPPPGADGPDPGPGAPGPADGDHLRHRHPGQRGALYHGGGRPGGNDLHFSER